MQKILNYIKNGKGYGAIFLIASAAVITTFIMLYFKTIFTDIKPKIELIAQDFLPITITNNQISSPIDTYKSIDVNLDPSNPNETFPIILDTKSSSVELPKDKLALYISKEVLYIITPQEIKKITYEDGVYDTAAFSALLNKTESIMSSSISLIMILGLFLSFLLKSIILMLIAKLISKKINSTPLPNQELMRLSCIIVSVLELISAIAERFTDLKLGIMVTTFIGAYFCFIYLTNQNKTDNQPPL